MFKQLRAIFVSMCMNMICQKVDRRLYARPENKCHFSGSEKWFILMQNFKLKISAPTKWRNHQMPDLYFEIMILGGDFASTKKKFWKLKDFLTLRQNFCDTFSIFFSNFGDFWNRGIPVVIPIENHRKPSNFPKNSELFLDKTIFLFQHLENIFDNIENFKKKIIL